ncbi:MAG: hypothetical protein WC757_00390 [Candidatus Paceibacterota bacterium]|jgi:hypothetical protein
MTLEEAESILLDLIDFLGHDPIGALARTMCHSGNPMWASPSDAQSREIQAFVESVKQLKKQLA